MSRWSLATGAQDTLAHLLAITDLLAIACLFVFAYLLTCSLRAAQPGIVCCRWLENIRDWCVSRQLWWGHRIPAYYITLEGENAKAAGTQYEQMDRSRSAPFTLSLLHLQCALTCLPCLPCLDCLCRLSAYVEQCCDAILGVFYLLSTFRLVFVTHKAPFCSVRLCMCGGGGALRGAVCRYQQP